jgi:hypothetical protein
VLGGVPQQGVAVRQAAVRRRTLGAAVDVLGDEDELPVAGQLEQRAVEGPVGLGVRGPVARARGRHRRLGERAQLLPPFRGQRAGQPLHGRDLQRHAHLGEFGGVPGGAARDAEAAVGHRLDHALAGEPLHGLAHGGGGDAVPFSQRGRRVDLAGGQLTAGESVAQRGEHLGAHGVALRQGAGPDRQRRAVSRAVVRSGARRRVHRVPLRPFRLPPRNRAWRGGSEHPSRDPARNGKPRPAQRRKLAPASCPPPRED